MFINQILSPFASLECSSLLVLNHLFVPVWQHVSAEPGSQYTELEETGARRTSIPGAKLDNADSKVRVVDTEVVRDAPHDYKMDILLLEFPGYGATGPSEPTIFIIHHHHHLTVAREHFSLVVT